MGTINYTITSGNLPIVVQLFKGSLLQSNQHYSFGSYSFNNVTYEDGMYLKFIDGVLPGCYSIAQIYKCGDCPEGYEAVGDKCIYYDEVDPIFSSPFTIIKKNYSSYTIKGVLVFDSWNYNGTGTYTLIPPTNTFWCNTNTSNGVMNRSAVWASTRYDHQDIKFSFCIDIYTEKTYYIGVGCDNYAKIKLNGVYILEQDVEALKTMMSTSSDGVTFEYWYIYPITFPVGTSILEVYGHNVFDPDAAVGIQIYDATALDLINANNEYIFADKIKFSSEELVNEDLMYEYTALHGYHGYVCPEGYSLSCDFPPSCIKRIELDCGTPAPSTSTTTSTTSTSTSSTTTTSTTIEGGYNTLFVYYEAL